MQDILIEEGRFAFIDTETTGLSPASGGRVCEVAVLLKQGAQTLAEYSALINPQCSIPAEVSAIHGITDAMVAGAPQFKDIAPELISLLDGAAVVCHNADFDIPFLAAELARCGLRLPGMLVLDTLKYARKSGQFKKNRLGCIAEELGFSNEGWHRAMADVKMTEKVFAHFLEYFKNAGAKTLGDLQEYQVRKFPAAV